MKKCLIIAGDLGISAPGKVYESIIKEISKLANIYVISLKKTDDNYHVHFLPYKKLFYEHSLITNLILTLFGRSLVDEYWLLKQKKLIKPDIIKEMDVVISFTSFHNYKSIILGHYLSKTFAKKWIIYSVDAIPAPIGWIKNDLFYRRVQKFISKYISSCDAFLSSNEQMLEYQLSFLDIIPPITSFLYTPIHRFYNEEFVKNICGSNPVFIYTGGIYGPRRKEALLDGFRKFILEYPQAKLIFVGTFKANTFSSYDDLIKSHNIEIHEYSSSLEKYYKVATALIDLNAYFNDDVYLSSKIVNYLPICKPIISITGYNSPSRNIFKDDESIVHCLHDDTEVCKCLKYVTTKSFNYEKRKVYINIFSPKKIVQEFSEVIDNVLSDI